MYKTNPIVKFIFRKELKALDDDLINDIGAGMFVSAKHFLIQDSAEMAFQYFDNIVVSCLGKTKFIKVSISLLIEHKMPEEAKKNHKDDSVIIVAGLDLFFLSKKMDV